MTRSELCELYRGYIACLNAQDWPDLGTFVHEEVRYNGRKIGVAGYRAMLERDFHDIPDLHFNVRILISDSPCIASRLDFDCTPEGRFLGLPVDGKRVSFSENVFYEFKEGKIAKLRSVIDNSAIERQI